MSSLTKENQKKNPVFTETEVNVELAKRGINRTFLATAIGRSNSQVSLAINHGAYPKVRQRIAEYLNLSN